MKNKRRANEPTRIELQSTIAKLQGALKEKDDSMFEDALSDVFFDAEDKDIQAEITRLTTELQQAQQTIAGFKAAEQVQKEQIAQQAHAKFLSTHLGETHSSIEGEIKELKTSTNDALTHLDQDATTMQVLLKSTQTVITRLEASKKIQIEEGHKLRQEAKEMNAVIGQTKEAIAKEKEILKPFDAKNDRYKKAWKITKLYLVVKNALYKLTRAVLNICTLGLLNKLKPLVQEQQIRDNVKREEELLEMAKSSSSFQSIKSKRQDVASSVDMLIDNIKSLQNLSQDLETAISHSVKAQSAQKSLGKAQNRWRFTDRLRGMIGLETAKSLRVKSKEAAGAYETFAESARQAFQKLQIQQRQDGIAR